MFSGTCAYFAVAPIFLTLASRLWCCCLDRVFELTTEFFEELGHNVINLNVVVLYT